MKLLIGDDSRDNNFIEELAMKKASTTVELMHFHPHLRDMHSEFLLL